MISMEASTKIFVKFMTPMGEDPALGRGHFGHIVKLLYVCQNLLYTPGHISEILNI